MNKISSGIKQINIQKAVMFITISSLSLSITSLLVKLTTPHTTTSMTLFFRFIISFIYILIVLFVQSLNGNRISLKVQNPYLHFIRSVLATITLSLFFLSLRYIDTMNTTVLSMTNTLFIPIVSILLLRIRTKVSVVLAIILGFIGAILVIKPDSGIFDFHSLFALGSGLSSAFSFTLLREIAKKDKAEVTMFYYFLFALIVSSIMAFLNWYTPDFRTLTLLLGIGIFGTVFQECLIRASSHAPASVTAPLFYLSVIFSGVFDWLFFKIIPSLEDVLGVALIVMSSFMVIRFSAQKSEIERI